MELVRESQARRCNYFVLITEPPTDARDYICFNLALLEWLILLASHFGWLFAPPGLAQGSRPLLSPLCTRCSERYLDPGCFVTAPPVGTTSTGCLGAGGGTAWQCVGPSLTGWSVPHSLPEISLQVGAFQLLTYWVLQFLLWESVLCTEGFLAVLASTYRFQCHLPHLERHKPKYLWALPVVRAGGGKVGVVGGRRHKIIASSELLTEVENVFNLSLDLNSILHINPKSFMHNCTHAALS